MAQPSLTTFIAVAKDNLGRIDTNTPVAYLPSSPAFIYDANGNLIYEVHKMRNNGQKVSKLAVICLVLFGVVMGCRERVPRASKEERERVVSALDEMYKRYISGTVTEARSNLLKAVTVMQENSDRIPELQTGLPMGYARLSLLERKAGFEALSRIYFEKSRYWRIIEFERSGQKPDEIISNHDSVSREDSDKSALDWDINYTKGAGPAYLKQLR